MSMAVPCGSCPAGQHCYVMAQARPVQRRVKIAPCQTCINRCLAKGRWCQPTGHRQPHRVQCCISDFAGGESPALTKYTSFF